MVAKDKSKATSEGLAKLVEKLTVEWNRQIILPQQVKLSKRDERLKWQRLDPESKQRAVDEMGRDAWDELMRGLYGEA